MPGARSRIATLLIVGSGALTGALAPGLLVHAAGALRTPPPWIAPDRPAPHADEIRHGAIHIFL
jgi:hypothetical protein